MALGLVLFWFGHYVDCDETWLGCRMRFFEIVLGLLLVIEQWSTRSRILRVYPLGPEGSCGLSEISTYGLK